MLSSLRGLFLSFRRQRLQWLGLFLGALLPLLLFGFLAESIRSQNHQGVPNGLWGDVPLLQWLHGYASPTLNETVARLTILGGMLAVPGILTLAVFLSALLRQPRPAAFFLACASGAWALDVMAKLIFHRPRPHLWPSPLPESDFSFPSGHAMVSMALTVSLILLAWPTKWRWPLVLVGIAGVLGTGLSRLYLGVHYPSDILAGWCAALIWVFGLHRLILREPNAHTAKQAFHSNGEKDPQAQETHNDRR